MNSNNLYDTEKTIVIGNFKKYTGPYEEPIYANRILSPYYKYPVSHKGNTYPSLINFLYSVRLCYKDIKDQMIELEPEDVPSFYKKKRVKCNKLFDKLGMKIGKNNFQSADEYIVEITKESLNILYKYFSSNNTLKEALMSTGVSPIVFVDDDAILGTATEKKGLNMLGNMMVKVRTYLIENHMRSSIALSKLETFSNLELKLDDIYDYKNYKNNNFNDLENWAFKMLIMYCSAVAYFFNYLCQDRRDFIRVIKGSNLEELEGDKFALYGDYSDMEYNLKNLGGIVKNVNKDGEKKKAWVFPLKVKTQVKQLIFASTFGVNPVVSVNIAKYVAHDIFHCSFTSEFNNIYFPEVSDKMKTTIEHVITSVLSSDPELYETTTVSFQACNYLWKHICMMCEHVYVSASFEDDFVDNEGGAMKQILQASKNSVENLKRDYVDYGFNTENENCILQAILYIIVALTDSLEVDEVTMMEYNAMYNILLVDLPRIKGKSVNSGFGLNVMKAFNEKGLIINTDMAEVIGGLVEKLSKEMNRKEVLNRIMFFANII